MGRLRAAGRTSPTGCAVLTLGKELRAGNWGTPKGQPPANGRRFHTRPSSLSNCRPGRFPGLGPDGDAAPVRLAVSPRKLPCPAGTCRRSAWETDLTIEQTISLGVI